MRALKCLFKYDNNEISVRYEKGDDFVENTYLRRIGISKNIKG